MRPLDDRVKGELDSLIIKIEEKMDSDVIAIHGPIFTPLDSLLKEILEKFKNRRTKLSVLLDTGGGSAEVTERMVNIIRYLYSDEVSFIVPNKAMSAGTIFALSGDRILMNYFSCLGPIDPQIQKDKAMVPALSYLEQYYELVEKSRRGELTTAEFALLNKLDLGELRQYKEVKDLSIELVTKWLIKYKFKNWNKTETNHNPVTTQMKQMRAKEISEILSDYTRWHTHSRPIDLNTLVSELKLKIEDYGQNKELKDAIDNYYNLLNDYIEQKGQVGFIHTREFF